MRLFLSLILLFSTPVFASGSLGAGNLKNIFAAGYAFCNKTSQPMAYASQVYKEQDTSWNEDKLTLGWKELPVGKCTYDRVLFWRNVNAFQMLMNMGNDIKEFAFVAKNNGVIENVVLDVPKNDAFLVKPNFRYLCVDSSMNKFVVKNVEGNIFNNRRDERHLAAGEMCRGKAPLALIQASFSNKMVTTYVDIDKAPKNGEYAFIRYYDIYPGYKVKSRVEMLSKQEFMATGAAEVKNTSLNMKGWKGELKRPEYDTFFPLEAYETMGSHPNKVCGVLEQHGVVEKGCVYGDVYRTSKDILLKNLKERGIQEKDLSKAVMSGEYVPSLPDIMNVWHSYMPDVDDILSYKNDYYLRVFAQLLSANTIVDYKKKSRYSRETVKTVSYPFPWYTEEIYDMKEWKQPTALEPILRAMSPSEVEEVNHWLRSVYTPGIFAQYRNEKFNEQFGGVSEGPHDTYLIQDAKAKRGMYNKRQLYVNSALLNGLLFSYYRSGFQWVDDAKKGEKNPKKKVDSVKKAAIARLANPGQYPEDEKFVDTKMYLNYEPTVLHLFGGFDGGPEYQVLRKVYLDKNNLNGMWSGKLPRGW